VAPLPLLTRLWFAWVCFFRVLFNGEYGARLFHDRALPPAPAPAAPLPAPERAKPSTDAALQLLALFQREGRLVDFLEEDVASFSDADIGAAARVVHTGCQKALREHVELRAVRSEEEGARVTLPVGFDPAEIKLTGNVQGSGPHTGTLRHRGWRAEKISLPTAAEGHDPRVVAQAEVEL
jgi:hypothetical protein